MLDSKGDDTFVATPDEATLSGGGFNNQASAFRSVYAWASAGGNDQAHLVGSGGDDTFAGRIDSSRMSGAGYFIEANLFDQVHAYGAGGYDRACLYDSPGNDAFVGRCYQVTDGFVDLDILLQLMPLLGGNGGNDHLDAVGSLVRITYSEDHWINAYDFSWVEAHSTEGGLDTKHVEATDYLVETYGPWEDV
jgi:hypothetical protein